MKLVVIEGRVASGKTIELIRRLLEGVREGCTVYSNIESSVLEERGVRYTRGFTPPVHAGKVLVGLETYLIPSFKVSASPNPSTRIWFKWLRRRSHTLILVCQQSWLIALPPVDFEWVLCLEPGKVSDCGVVRNYDPEPFYQYYK